MTKYIKFQVSEERFTKYKLIGFENIDRIINDALDLFEQKEQNNGKNAKPK